LKDTSSSKEYEKIEPQRGWAGLPPKEGETLSVVSFLSLFFFFFFFFFTLTGNQRLQVLMMKKRKKKKKKRGRK
jgi:hypothetical protein